MFSNHAELFENYSFVSVYVFRTWKLVFGEFMFSNHGELVQNYSFRRVYVLRTLKLSFRTRRSTEIHLPGLVDWGR